MDLDIFSIHIITYIIPKSYYFSKISVRIPYLYLQSKLGGEVHESYHFLKSFVATAYI